MRGIILAAGLGTRLLPLTLWRAKPAIPFLNRPLVQYALDQIRAAGISEVAINLHHLPHTVIQSIPCETRIHYSLERSILGTGGALQKVRGWLQGDDLLVCNGKIYFEEDLNRVVAFHRETGATATLVLIPRFAKDPFRPVFVDAKQNITSFGKAQGILGKEEPFTFSGVQVLSSQALDHLQEGYSDTVQDLYPLLMQKSYRVKGFISTAYWCECSTPSHYLKNSLATLRHKRLSNMVSNRDSTNWEGVVAAPDVQIESRSNLRNCLLWSGSKVGRNCSLTDTIVTSGVTLPPGTELQGVIATLPVSKQLSRKPSPVISGIGYSIWPLEASNY